VNVRPTVKSLAFSDIHIDTHYKTGAPTSCPYTCCCREVKGLTKSEDDPGAPKYGDAGHCDLPPVTFESMLEFIAEQNLFEAKFVAFMGDCNPHDAGFLTFESTW
jgi:sphingomyelin phosphodiesterase